MATVSTNPGKSRTSSHPYQNPELSIAKRVDDLVTRMTLKEKVAQLQCHIGADDPKLFISRLSPGSVADLLCNVDSERAAQRYNELQAQAIQTHRLHIPILFHDEAISGLKNYRCSSFPQPMTQAATWNPELVYQMAKAIAVEAHDRGIRQVLSPTINIVRDPRWGRTNECFGEDPWLTARFAVAYVKGFEENGIITTPKHFAANQGESGHNAGAVSYGRRLLHEVYFPAFKAAVQEGGATSIMCAYNTIDGVPCSCDKWLLTELLREEWGFTGFVTSDYGSVEQVQTIHGITGNMEETAKATLEAGVDVETPLVSAYGAALLRAVKKGMVAEKVVDTAVKRVLAAKFKVGLFDTPFVSPPNAVALNDCAAHRQLSLDIARQGIMLLKNKDSVLPLSKDLRNIALLGPLCDEVPLGPYSGWGMRTVTLREAVQVKLPDCRQHAAHGAEIRTRRLPSIAPRFFSYQGQPGLHAEYFANSKLEGTPVLTRCDANIAFNWGEGAPAPEIPTDHYSVRWTGMLKSPGNGPQQLKLFADDGGRVFIDGQLVLNTFRDGSTQIAEATYNFEAHREYALVVECYTTYFFTFAHLGWSAGIEESIAHAVTLARQSEVAIISCGLVAGECQDRASLDLDAEQEALIQAVAATGTPTVVVIQTGDVITMGNWINEVAGVVYAGFCGEEAGTAIADVLFGDVNPGGKLPITIPAQTAQVPLYYNRLPQGAGGVYVNAPMEPLFPFGFGLSYTTFALKNLKLLSKAIYPDGEVKICCEVENTGVRAGDEVVQLYIHDRVASVVQPIKKLKRFQRVSLQPGETRAVTFTLTQEDLAILDCNMQWTVEPGEFDILLGTSSRDIHLQATLTVRPARNGK